MTGFALPSRYVSHVDRLLLGIQPIDGVRDQPLTHCMEIVVEPRKPLIEPLTSLQQRWLTGLADSRKPLSDTWPRASRHVSGRHAVTYEAKRGAHLDIRILDRSQRIVPRRIRVPLVDLGTPESLDVLDALPASRRSRFPSLLPGAAYDITERVTGLRGRVVVSDGGTPPKRIPVRWPRVLARLASGGAPLAWAHGDQFGEFVLILPPEAIAMPAVVIPRTLELLITAFGRRGIPAGAPPALVRKADPFWDLPLEEIGPPSVAPAVDATARGRAIPADYDGSDSQNITFSYTQFISSGIPPFDIT
jgi:hypothetical protein